MSKKLSIAERVASLEQEVCQLKTKLEGFERGNNCKDDWLDKIAGSFANDPAFEEAMRLGREWRESFRPKPRKRKKKV